jgi:hypothetical protein
MIRVPCEVKKSEIHGTGVFATEALHTDRVVWTYEPGMDRAISDYAVKYGDPEVMRFIQERGYINPARPNLWILCCDEGQFINFPKEGETANLRLGGLIDGEYVLLAARNIESGEELTVPPESDADYDRKMKSR